MCKHGNVFSLAVLIGRGLDHNLLGFKLRKHFPHNIRFCFVQFSGYTTLFHIPHSNECGIFLFVDNFLLSGSDFSTAVAALC